MTDWEKRLVDEPDDVNALLAVGHARLAAHNTADAISLFERALKAAPSARIHYYLGGALNAAGNAEGALKHFDAALALNPNNPPTQLHRARAMLKLDQPQDALLAAETALHLAPTFAPAWQTRGDALTELGQTKEALRSFRHAAMLTPQVRQEWLEAAEKFMRTSHFSEAIALCNRIIDTGAPIARAFRLLGDAYAILRQNTQAEQAYHQALHFDPENAEIYLGLGDVLSFQVRIPEALSAYARAIRIRPDFQAAIEAHGNRLADLYRYSEAEHDYEQLRQITPNHIWAAGRLLAVRREAVNWQEHEILLKELTEGLKLKTRRLWAFESLSLLNDPALQYQVMQEQIADLKPAGICAPATLHPRSKIRVGYLSGDFHSHATVYLMAGLFEAHDKQRFETVGLSCGQKQLASNDTTRVRAAMDAFIDLPPLPTPDADISKIIAEQDLDIVVDLSGFTTRGRPMALAHRPAPIQVSYLGYPGTLGDGFIDYILADRFVIPAGDDRFYTEKVVRLPHSYQPNSLRQPANEPVSRAAFGLPEDGIVFCCFNNLFKLNPEPFTAWMNILRECDASVLWVLTPDDITAKLKRYAASHGISPDRIIATEFQPFDRHLARLALADIMLDTWPYGAHTTASDALFMGVPLITWAGRTFASRVGASLLNAVGLPELCADSPQSFETMAVNLAHQPERLLQIKMHLLQARKHAPLFDIKRTTRAVEMAYEKMYLRAREGLPPASFDVPDF